MALKIQGIDKLISQLESVIDNKWVEEGIKKTSERIVADAKQNLTDNGSVETGDLRNSITSNLEKNSTTVQAEIGTNVEYAPFVEWGTGVYNVRGEGRNTPWCYKDPETGEFVWTEGSKPYPFMEPAYLANKKNIARDLKESLDKAVR